MTETAKVVGGQDAHLPEAPNVAFKSYELVLLSEACRPQERWMGEVDGVIKPRIVLGSAMQCCLRRQDRFVTQDEPRPMLIFYARHAVLF